MKKVVSSLILALLFLLVACGQNDAGKTTMPEITDPTVETTEAVTHPNEATEPEETVHIHRWMEATCADPKTCSDCGATEGEALPHNWQDATCVTPKTCTACGTIDGEAPGHTWKPATCKQPKQCTVCNATEGRPAGHNWDQGQILSQATEEKDGSILYTCVTCKTQKQQIIPALNHVHSYIAEVTKPDCTHGGFTTHTCQCGDSYTDHETQPAGHQWTSATCTTPQYCAVCAAVEGTAKGHEFGQWQETVTASCTAQGKMERSCQNCGKVETRTVEKTDHVYRTLITEPTCTEGGYTTYTCICGDTYTDNQTPTKGHSWQPSTCTEPQYCANCSLTQGAPNGHEMGQWEVTVAATCLTEGSEQCKCIHCDHVESRPIEKSNHIYVSTVTEPTCTKGGYTWHVCLHCGNNYYDTHTAALDHDYGKWSVSEPATCNSSGVEEQVCSRCSKKNYRSIPISSVHDWSDWVVTESTCVYYGCRERTCSVCNRTEDENLEQLAPHTYGAWQNQPATCIADGIRFRECSVCWDRQEEITEQANGVHSWSQWTVTKEANGCLDGSRNHHCIHCATYEYESIPGNGEHDQIVVDSQVANCGHEGYIRRCCRLCGEYETEITPMVGEHIWSAFSLEYLPTCTKVGRESRTCSVCRDYDWRDIAATGIHEYNRTLTTRPTATKTGLYTYCCTYCKGTYTKVIPVWDSRITGGDPHYIRSSYSRDHYYALTIDGKTLKVEGILQNDGLTAFEFYISGVRREIAVSQNAYFSAVYDISNITQEAEITCYAVTSTGLQYIPESIPIKPLGDSFEFVHSPIVENNLESHRWWIDPQDCLRRDEPFLEVTDRVQELSDSIVGSETDDYRKMYLLNKWVAENIYYDFDYYEGRKADVYARPDDVIEYRYTVCEGYSRLLTALCRAQGIPAIYVSTISGSPDELIAGEGGPHAHVEAYLVSEGRWVTMDPTWDSGNKYRNGEFIKGESCILWFDISPDFFASTHWIVNRFDWYSEQLKDY